MKGKLALAVVAAVAFAVASAACGGDNKNPPLTPDQDKPADLADAGATTTPPVAK